MDFLIDGTERPVHRPPDATVKNTLIADVEDRLVRHLSEAYAGRTRDKRICDLEEPVFVPDINLFQDIGFQGYHPPGVTVYQPKKKPKGGELTVAEKAQKTILSSIRILIEHIISGVKRCRIVKDIFRSTNWSCSNMNCRVLMNKSASGCGPTLPSCTPRRPRR